MRLGLFAMPVHRPEKPWHQALREDQEAVVLADALGFSEAWIGEHYSTKTEQIPSPLMFLASLIDRAPNIRLGTGVLGLPYRNPAIVAAEAALFDQLSGGRLMLGIGPGGLPSDGELFGLPDIGERNALMAEAIDAILAIWREEQPYRLEGTHWRARLESMWPEIGIGYAPKPRQRPHPPIAMAVTGRHSATARRIGERGWIPISANFAPAEDVATHWPVYAEGCEGAGLRPDRSLWRVARNILVTESDVEAADILADPDGAFAFYFRYLRGLRRIAELEAHHAARPEALNELLDVRAAIEGMVIAGGVGTVTDRLVALYDETGGFGTLLLAAHDWEGEAGLHKASMRRLADHVMPRLARHAGAGATPADG